MMGNPQLPEEFFRKFEARVQEIAAMCGECDAPVPSCITIEFETGFRLRMDPKTLAENFTRCVRDHGVINQPIEALRRRLTGLPICECPDRDCETSQHMTYIGFVAAVVSAAIQATIHAELEADAELS